MTKQIVLCPKCETPLKFRGWSNRYPKQFRWREALANCQSGCGKWALRYFDGSPTCEPYQVKAAARKTCRGSYKIDPARKSAITAIYGTVQNYLDKGVLVGMPLQNKQ